MKPVAANILLLILTSSIFRNHFAILSNVLVEVIFKCFLITLTHLLSLGGKRGGAVAEWSKALLVRENKRKIKKIPGSPPDLGNFLEKKNELTNLS